MKSALATIIEKAEAKFGAIEKVKNKGNQCYLLTIKRSAPTFAEYPYMTINAGYTLGNTNGGISVIVDFFTGHYDLSQDAIA